MPTKIFVGNLSAETQSNDIRILFEKYGQVVECDVLNRYGFVHMKNEGEAMSAIDEIAGLEVHGSKINVELSRSKPRRDGGGDRGGYGRGGGGRGMGRGGGRGGRGGGFSRGGGGPPQRRGYEPYPHVDRYERYDRYNDYYRSYDRARPYPDPYEHERRIPGERPMAPMYDRRPPPSARLTPPTDPYRRPPPEYYDRSYGAGYETRRELPGQAPREHADFPRERDPYLAREREYALADRGDHLRPLPSRDPYAREREPAGNGYDYRSEYRRSELAAYPEYSRGAYGDSAYASPASAPANNYSSAAESYRDPYNPSARQSAQDGYGQQTSTPQAQGAASKMDQSFLAKGPIFF